VPLTGPAIYALGGRDQALYGNPGFGHRGQQDAVKKNRRGEKAITSFVAVPAEAAVIAEATALLLQGLAAHAVCTALNDTGKLTRAGSYWKHGSLKRVLTNPRMIGLGRRNGVPYEANIEPLMSQGEFDAVCEAFNARSRKRAKVRKYPLSNLLECGYCGDGMTGQYYRAYDYRAYACVKRLAAATRRCSCEPGTACRCDRRHTHPRPRASRIEDFVFEAALACYDVERALIDSCAAASGPGTVRERRKSHLSEQLQQLTDARRRVFEAHMELAITDADKARRLAKLDAKRDKITADLHEIAEYERRRDPGMTMQDVRELMWTDAQFARDRVDGVIERIKVDRVPGSGDPERGVTIIWRDDLATTPSEKSSTRSVRSSSRATTWRHVPPTTKRTLRFLRPSSSGSSTCGRPARRTPP
jgi:hypothetical protein